MRALIVNEPGTAPVVAERPDPVATGDSVVVTVTAAAIPPLELFIASGRSYFGAPPCPYVPGLMGTGRTDDGRAVLFATTAGLGPGDGAMAERCLADPARMVELPEVDHAVAAALGNSAPAAIGALRLGGLEKGQTVIVLGANGTVGQVAIHVARAAGARVVAVARGADRLARAAAQGADATVDASGGLDAISEALIAACQGGADLVIDPIAGVPAGAALRALGPGGRLVNLGESAGPSIEVPSALIRSRQLRVLGFTILSLGWEGQSAAILEACGLAASGRLDIDIERVPLADAADAWSRQARGETTGRLVLVP